jgi:K+/H+ antiporter YhaU regulatory subunit KhtT
MSVAGDLTDILGRLLAIEQKFDKVFALMDELMRDQTEAEKKTEKLEQRVALIEEWMSRNGSA